MPLPTPNENEDRKDFISRAIQHEEMKNKFPSEIQRIAVSYSLWDNHEDSKK